MVVCIETEIGFYLRINSYPEWQPCVPIIKEPLHPFLKWDSNIECRILDLDDYIIEQALRTSGVIGSVSATLCRPILEAIGGTPCSRADRMAVWAALEPLIPK